MNKILLSLFYLFCVTIVNAQTLKTGMQDGVHGPNAVSIAVSSTDETIGDEYYANAEKNERKGDLNEALNLFGKAAFEYNSDKQLNRYANSLLRISNVHLQLNHYNVAEQIILNAVLKTYAKLGNKSGQMASYQQLGKIYLASNKLTQSLWFYTQQGILAQQLKNNTSLIESLLGMAAVKVKKKEYAMANRDLQKAEQLAKESKITQFSSQIKAQKDHISQKQKSKNSDN